MTESNRVQVALVRETTAGTTPTTPRMRKMRFTDVTPNFAPSFLDPDEIRDDRMMGDPIPSLKASAITLPYELSYPEDETPLSEVYRSAFYNPWTNTPQRYNDGTADSVITAVTAASDTYTVTTGAAFVEGHLVRATGFTNAGNNSVFRAQSGSGATAVVAPSSPGLTDETAPPGTARLKVVGCEGASADLTALADGIGSTALDFTTLGIPLGAWVKVGGTADATTFAFLVTAGLVARAGAFARVIAITATKLTLDHLPAGWTTDSGTGKTIRLFWGDQIKNGVTLSPMTVEVGYLGQTVPNYIAFKGQTVGQLTENSASGAKVTGTATMTGMDSAAPTTTPLDASPDAVTTAQVMAANAHVGRVSEAGAQVTSPNWCRALNWTINNNVRSIEAQDSQTPVATRPGECLVTVEFDTYFGDATYLNKFHTGTPTSISQIIRRNNQAIIRTWPRLTYREGNPTGHTKNSDVMLPFRAQASKDTLTSSHMYVDRIEYYE